MSKRRIEIAPSILSANFAFVGDAVNQINESGVPYVHLDVMDGSFVPPITFGAKLIKDIRPLSDLIFDVHLMIDAPERHIDEFADAGADIITIHAESTIHLSRLLSYIRSKGIKAGISIVPSTPVSQITPILELCDLVLVMTVNPGWGGQTLIQSCLDKVVELKEIREAEDYDFLISVDGGVNADTIQDVTTAGADIAVMGSAFFRESDKSAFIEKINTLVDESIR